MSEKAYFAGGCFWCTEAIFQQLAGVLSVIPGYANEAESIEIIFDPQILTYEKLLDVFFHTHNPTTLNQQGHDIGTEYRSMILWTTTAQRDAAKNMIQELTKTREFDQPIVTEVVPFETFHLAEEYHRDFFAKNPEAPYCQIVIQPKLSAFHKRYQQYLKSS